MAINPYEPSDPQEYQKQVFCERCCGNRTFWCPRCGTIKDVDGVSTPMLVSRVVEFCGTLDDNEPEDCETIVTLHRLGIHESITLPGQ